MKNITPLSNTSEGTPRYEQKRRGDNLLFDETGKRYDYVRGAAQLAMHAARTENPAVAQEVDAATVAPAGPTLASVPTGPNVSDFGATAQPAHDAAAFLDAARQDVAASMPAEAQPSKYLETHTRQDPANPLFGNASALTPRLLDDEIASDPLEDDFKDMGYKDVNNVAA